MDAFTKSVLLLFVLLNPFTMSVYLLELIRALKFPDFANQLVRAGAISLLVFLIFASAGDRIFQDFLQVRFSSFLIFGGITFLIIGVRLILGVGPPVEALRPQSGQVSGAIAMPFIVGPGTISASVMTGNRLELIFSVLAIALALCSAIAAILIIKRLHDYVRDRNERLIQRYTDIAGRVTALFTGTFAIEMILMGIEGWLTYVAAHT